MPLWFQIQHTELLLRLRVRDYSHQQPLIHCHQFLFMILALALMKSRRAALKMWKSGFYFWILAVPKKLRMLKVRYVCVHLLHLRVMPLLWYCCSHCTSYCACAYSNSIQCLWCHSSSQLMQCSHSIPSSHDHDHDRLPLQSIRRSRYHPTTNTTITTPKNYSTHYIQA